MYRNVMYLHDALRYTAMCARMSKDNLFYYINLAVFTQDIKSRYIIFPDFP